MIRYTTTCHQFKFPVDLSALEKVVITYSQGGIKRLEKTKSDFEIDKNCAVIRLTQAETAAFVPGCSVDIQIRMKTTQGEVLATETTGITVEDVLNTEVL